jgi:DNA polymerase-3 subunit alpha
MVDSADNTISIQDLIKHAKGNILVFGKLSSYWMDANLHLLVMLKQAFEKLYYQVDLSEYKAERIDVKVLQATQYFFGNFYVEESKSFKIEPVLLCDNYYIDKDEAVNKIILNKIASGAAHEQSDDQYYKDIDEHYSTIRSIFSSEKWDIEGLFARMCSHAVNIAEKAEACYDLGNMYMPRYDMSSNEKTKYGNTHTMFLSLLEDGLKKLCPPGKEEEYRKRLDYEIYILESTNNVDYMLVQYDTVNWARQNGILVGCGRGSAGGCLALYLLGITLVDPIKYDLLFERFLLPERAGLYSAPATMFLRDISSKHFIEIELENGQCIKLDVDAQLLVQRENEEIIVYADQLHTADQIVFDNRDLIFSVGKYE